MGGQTIHAGAEAPGLDAGWALLPAESPLQMPEQTLRAGELKVRRHRTSPRLIGLRRFYIFGGTLAMTAEYRHRTATYTFLFAPRRWQVLTAKLVTFGGAGLVYGLVLAVSAGAGFYGALAARGVTPGLAAGTVWELLLRLALTMAVYTLLGVAMGALIRNMTVALAVVIGYLYMGELILMMIPGVNLVYPLLPGGATASLTSFTYVAEAVAGELATSPVSLLSPVGGGLLLAGYALVAAAVAVLVPMRRDVV